MTGRSTAEYAKPACRRAGPAPPLDEQEFPSPGDPMAVARQLATRLPEDGHFTLRRWRGMWMEWQGTEWAEAEDELVSRHLYRRLEKAWYVTTTTKDTRDQAVGAEPLQDQNLIKALGMLTLLPKTSRHLAWLDEHPAPPGRSWRAQPVCCTSPTGSCTS